MSKIAWKTYEVLLLPGQFDATEWKAWPRPDREQEEIDRAKQEMAENERAVEMEESSR